MNKIQHSVTCSKCKSISNLNLFPLDEETVRFNESVGDKGYYQGICFYCKKVFGTFIPRGFWVK